MNSPLPARSRTRHIARFAACLSFVLLGGHSHLMANTDSAPTNPVINRNFPDPALLNDHGVYYAYATNHHDEANLQVATSTDLAHWTALPDALPVMPAWAKPGKTWAPDVTMIEHGKRYVMYFAADDKRTGKQAVGVAVSTSPAGPFVGVDEPLIEQTEIGGAIDPCCYVEDTGERYLVWKNDGNSMSVDTWIWIQKLSTDGTKLEGDAVKLIKQDQSWEGNLVEAPCLWKHGGKFYLFYSANAYVDGRYAIGYATSDHLMGPYHKPLKSAWIASTDDQCGPGGCDIEQGADGLEWMVYHRWEKGPHTYRSMCIKRLEWDGDVPVLKSK